MHSTNTLLRRTAALAKQDRLLVGLLFILAFIVFSPCLNNAFTWDDFIYITNNSSIQGLSPDHLKTIFTTPINGSYHPLTQLSFAIEYHFFKLNPWIYHLDNIILHALNTILVFWFIRLFATSPIAFVTALLFGIHPLRVESIAWAAERKDVLFSFFYLCTLIQYGMSLRKIHVPNKLYICLGLFVLAVLSKPQAASLPLALLSIDYLFKRKWDLTLLREKIPFLMISIVSILGAIWGGKHLMGAHRMLGAAGHLSLIQKLFFSTYAFVFYMYQCIFPFNLSVIYFYPTEAKGGMPLIVYVAPLIMVVGMIILHRIRLSRALIWAMIFYGVTILLPLGNIWIGGNLVADRYSYVPSIGVFFIMATVLVAIDEKYRVAKWLFLIYVCFLGASSFLRCGIWKDYLTMTSSIIRQHPDADTYNLRGEIYLQNGQNKLAINDFNQAIHLNSGYALAFYNRGSAYSRENDLLRAYQDLSRAIALSPSDADAFWARGVVNFRQEHPALAFQDFDKALRIDPKNVDALFNLGTAYLNVGETQAGIETLTKAISIYPGNATLYLNRGVAVLARKPSTEKNYLQALSDFNKTIELDPKQEEAYLNRGYIEDHRRDFRLSLTDYAKAIALKPDDAEAYNDRAITYFHMSDYGHSWQDAQKAQALGYPVDPHLLQALGTLSHR